LSHSTSPVYIAESSLIGVKNSSSLNSTRHIHWLVDPPLHKFGAFDLSSPNSTAAVISMLSSPPSGEEILPIRYKDGTLIQIGEQRTIYILEDHRLRMFPSGKAFTSRGYSFDDVQRIHPFDAHWFYGEPIK
jgi:hypothetical protein